MLLVLLVLAIVGGAAGSELSATAPTRGVLPPGLPFAAVAGLPELDLLGAGLSLSCTSVPSRFISRSGRSVVFFACRSSRVCPSVSSSCGAFLFPFVLLAPAAEFGRLSAESFARRSCRKFVAVLFCRNRALCGRALPGGSTMLLALNEECKGELASAGLF